MSYHSCKRGADGSLPIAWPAGTTCNRSPSSPLTTWQNMRKQESWPNERLLLVGLRELVPWLKQWHNDLDPNYGERMGDYYEGSLKDEVRALGVTLGELRAWELAAVAAKRGQRRKM
ncbi:hypothetical protein GCM10027514_38480 [Azotobacter armeniacus]